ncbi:MAG TPA: hypothetical protein PLB10_18255, partial [Thiolinea sp.]|nr:hypothetical protein [Thiolinea sp.]
QASTGVSYPTGLRGDVLVTLAVAFWLLGEPAAWYQWLGCAPLTIGCWLLVSRQPAIRRPTLISSSS